MSDKKVTKKDIKIGDKYLITKSGTNNGYCSSFNENEEVIITENPPGDTSTRGYIRFTSTDRRKSGITYHPSTHLKYLSSLNEKQIQENITNYKKQIAGINDKIKEEQSKLDWMEEAGVDTFNQDEYTIWKALETLEKKGISKMEKVKKLNEIINNKKK